MGEQAPVAVHVRGGSVYSYYRQNSDHHCPWLGGKCVGHRTYPSFFHFITCITLFSAYVTYLAGTAFWWSLHNPTSVLVSQATKL
ncbi:hypothetical protein EDD15DRAFT_2331168 [Pisolithus albus]|nr:hypothetical protein EDD15DRAFT_2331168 [Pisolithus albus]